MGIYIGGCGEVAVTEPFLYLFHRYAVCKQQRCAAVSKVMIAYTPQLILVEQFRECRRKIMGRNQRPHLVHANVFQIPIVIAFPAHPSVFCLLLFDFQELFFENKHKGKRPHA